MRFLKSGTQTKIRQFDMAIGIKQKIIGFNVSKMASNYDLYWK